MQSQKHYLLQHAISLGLTAMAWLIPAAALLQAADRPGPVLGKWRATHAAAVQYKNSNTGALAPTSGSSFFYEFLPDGTYRNNGTLQVTTYGCTSSVFRDQSGQYRVEGDHLTIEPSRGVVRSQMCGGPPKEKADDLSTHVYAFHFESNAGTDVLVINGTDANTRPDFFRREK